MNVEAWKKHFVSMSDGKMSEQPFYSLTNQKGGNQEAKIELVTPTQQAVEMAMSKGKEQNEKHWEKSNRRHSGRQRRNKPKRRGKARSSRMQEGHSKELAIFQSPIVDTGVESVEWVGFRPVSQLSSNAPLEFSIPGHSTSYIDLKRTRLQVKIKLVKTDGTPVVATSKVGLVNLSLQSMWSQLDVSLQHQVISPNVGNNYAYRAYLDCLLDYEEDAKLSWLQSQLYYQDTRGYMDDPDPIGGSNNGLILRYEETKDGNVVSMEGPLYHDLWNQDRYILNGVHLGIKLWPQKPTFSLMSADAGADYHIKIVDAMLKVCLIKVSPGVVIGHNEALEKMPASYPFTRSDVRSFTVAAGQYEVKIEDIFQGILPSRLILGLVSAQAYSGSFTKNPFNFQAFNCSSVALYIDGKSVPGSPLSLNYNQGDYVEGYLSLFTGTGKHMRNTGNYVSREDYDKGYAIYILDVEGKEGDTKHSYLKRGHTRLELRFSRALPEAISVVVYGTYPGTLQIDKSRDIRA